MNNKSYLRLKKLTKIFDKLSDNTLNSWINIFHAKRLN